jgi:predicted nucleotidyltransferase
MNTTCQYPNCGIPITQREKYCAEHKKIVKLKLNREAQKRLYKKNARPHVPKPKKQEPVRKQKCFKCPYSPGVECKHQACEHCGFYPPVAEARKHKLRSTV